MGRSWGSRHLLRTVAAPRSFRDCRRPAGLRGAAPSFQPPTFRSCRLTDLIHDAPDTHEAHRAGSLAVLTQATASGRQRRERSSLFERDEELARIEFALSDARNGRGRFVVVEGPEGIGKTALFAAARTAAAGHGMRVLRARGTELEGEFAFGVVRQLFEPALAGAPDPELAQLL